LPRCRAERAVNITDWHTATTPPRVIFDGGARHPGLNDFRAILDLKDIGIIGTFVAELHCPTPRFTASLTLLEFSQRAAWYWPRFGRSEAITNT